MNGGVYINTLEERLVSHAFRRQQPKPWAARSQDCETGALKLTFRPFTRGSANDFELKAAAAAAVTAAHVKPTLATFEGQSVEMKQGQEDIDMDAIGHLSRPGAPAELARVRALQMGRKSVLPRPHTRQTADYLCSTEHGSDGKETSQPFQTMLNNYMSFLLQQQQSYRAKRSVEGTQSIGYLQALRRKPSMVGSSKSPSVFSRTPSTSLPSLSTVNTREIFLDPRASSSARHGEQSSLKLISSPSSANARRRSRKPDEFSLQDTCTLSAERKGSLDEIARPRASRDGCQGGRGAYDELRRENQGIDAVGGHFDFKTSVHILGHGYHEIDESSDIRIAGERAPGFSAPVNIMQVQESERRWVTAGVKNSPLPEAKPMPMSESEHGLALSGFVSVKIKMDKGGAEEIDSDKDGCGVGPAHKSQFVKPDRSLSPLSGMYQREVLDAKSQQEIRPASTDIGFSRNRNYSVADRSIRSRSDSNIPVSHKDSHMQDDIAPW